MSRTSVVIIGAGQAGLAVSNLLTGRGVDHVVLERGRTADRWSTQRWDSLRLLTPNWMSRLPGYRYRGPDPAGFMPAAEVARYLAGYADSFGAPVVHGADVRAVRRESGQYRVDSTAGCWSADAVVVATGYCDRPAVPAAAAALDPAILQLTPDRYRNPGDVPDGRVLVVGASATGVQLADELAGAGREVVLAVGRHTRMPRRYRGMDIMWWLDAMGVFDTPLDADRGPRRPEPSLQIVGSPDHRDVDLPSLAARGVAVAGRFRGVDRGSIALAGDLAATTARADAALDRLLTRIDRHAGAVGLECEIEPADRPPPSTSVLRAGAADAARLDGIRTVIWATGYRRDYSWLQVPVFTAAGEIRQVAGRTPAPGLSVIGLRGQTRRSSTFLDGVRHDAALIVDHLTTGVLGGPGTVRSAS